METAVFIVSAIIVVSGALGVVGARNPVHSALSLVATLFGVAVLFLVQDAQFLAVVQVVVYAGAIVVLFLFVIMLLGVDQAENLAVEPIGGHRPLALAVALAVGVMGIVFVVVSVDDTTTGQPQAVAPILDSLSGQPTDVAPDIVDDVSTAIEEESNTRQLGRLIFTDYVFAFEITAVLLTIGVVAVIALGRRPDPDTETLGEEAT